MHNFVDIKSRAPSPISDKHFKIPIRTIEQNEKSGYVVIYHSYYMSSITRIADFRYLGFALDPVGALRLFQTTGRYTILHSVFICSLCLR